MQSKKTGIKRRIMPLQREHIQFAVLFFSVPLQYLVVQHMGSSETSRTYAISQLVEEISKLQTRWFRVEPWKNWCKGLLYSITEHAGLSGKPHDPTKSVFDPSDEQGESPALEVVKHKKWGYRGVIIAW